MRELLDALLDVARPRGAGPSRRGGGAGALVAALSGTLGTERLMRSMSEVSTLFAIVDRLATSTAAVDWHLWRKAASGEKKDRKRVVSHAALDLWTKPNSHYTRLQFVETFQQHLDLTGEAPWVISRVGKSMPLELWPVRPDRLTPLPHKQTFLAGYEYSAGGEKVPLGLDEVIRLLKPSPLDPYRGLGPVQALLTDLDATRFSAEWNRNFFLNSAEPGGIVEVGRHLDDNEFDELRERWAEQHRGVARAHRVAILEEGKWVDRKYSMRDMEFAALRGIGREIIREAFGFPKSMLGSVEDVNRANAEAGEVVFGRWLIVPRLQRIKDVLNHQLLPMYGQGSGSDLEFDYVPPVPEDRAADNEALTAQAQAFKTLVEAGVDPDDAAALCGMPPVRMVTKPAPAPVPAGGSRQR